MSWKGFNLKASLADLLKKGSFEEHDLMTWKNTKKARKNNAKNNLKKRDENTQFGYLSYQIFENFQNLIMESLWSNNCYILYAQMIAWMIYASQWRRASIW